MLCCKRCFSLSVIWLVRVILPSSRPHFIPSKNGQNLLGLFFHQLVDAFSGSYCATHLPIWGVRGYGDLGRDPKFSDVDLRSLALEVDRWTGTWDCGLPSPPIPSKHLFVLAGKSFKLKKIIPKTQTAKLFLEREFLHLKSSYCIKKYLMEHAT